MKVEILGGGCRNCKVLEENTRIALANKGMEAELVKVQDMEEIMKYGILSTPGLVIDGAVKSFGKVLSSREVETILEDLNQG